MTVVDYNKAKHQQSEIDAIEDVFRYKDSNTITWVIIEGLANTEIVEKIGKEFDSVLAAAQAKRAVNVVQRGADAHVVRAGHGRGNHPEP